MIAIRILTVADYLKLADLFDEGETLHEHFIRGADRAFLYQPCSDHSHNWQTGTYGDVYDQDAADDLDGYLAPKPELPLPLRYYVGGLILIAGLIWAVVTR